MVQSWLASADGRAQRRARLVVALLAAVAGPLWAAEPLSLAEAVRVAVARSPQLASQRSMIEASREMSIPAGELPDPQLIAGVENVPTSGADRFSLTRDQMTMTRVGVMQEFPRAEKRRLRSLRAEQEAQKGETGLQAAALAVQREAATAWINRHFAEAAESAVRAQIDEAELLVSATTAQYRAGKASQAELLAAQAMVVELGNRRVERAMQTRRASAALARYVGDEADRPLGEVPDLSRLPVEAAALADVELQPEIRTARAQETLAETESALARAGRLPDWSAELTYGVRGSGNPNMLSLMIRVGLPWSTATRQDKEYAAKLRELDAARAMREDVRRMRAAEVKQMEVEWEAARAQAARIRDELVPLAARRIEASFAAYRGGTAPLSQVLDARKAQLDTQLMLLDMEQTAARAWAWLANVVPSAS